MNEISPGWRYRLLSLLLNPLWQAHALLHGRKHGLRDYRAMRLGRLRGDHRERIWLHASSVGEVRAIAPLAQALLDRGHEILFTSFTATGYRTIEQLFGDSLCRGIIPIDCRRNCERFFDAGNIRLGIVMETELWPELLFQARNRGIKLLLVNARVSAKSMRGGSFVRRLLAQALARFSLILTRADSDREALLALGAPADRIRIVGNLKTRRAATTTPPPERLVERDYLLLASSHDGEERDFVAARPASPGGPLLVIAPRHPARSHAIQAQLDELGVRYAVRSQAQPIAAETEVYLADTLGELAALMAHARVVVMGGSFDRTGGHNLIEPAALGCAIITGPSDSNIGDDIEMLGNGEGLLQVESMQQCWRNIEQLLQDPARAEALGSEARARLERQPDILQAYLKELGPYL